MKTKIKAVLPVIVICIISLAAEFLLSNFVYFSYVAGNAGVRDYTPEGFSQAEISEWDNSFAAGELDLPIDSVRFTVKTADPNQSEGYAVAGFYIADENSTKTAALARKEKIAVGPQERVVTAYISSYGNASYLDITFEEVKTELIVTDLVINPTYKFSFNLLRFAAVFILIVFVYVMKRNGFGKKMLSELNYAAVASVCVAVCVSFSLLMTYLGISNGDGIYITYPFEYSAGNYQPYIQQFDAFMKGQLHLDVQPSQELLALENPYNPGERSGVSALFDRAFYNGKYFSYFGIAPIITVYMPFHFIGGFIPGDSIVTGIFSLIAAVFLPLAVIEWSKLRGKNPPWLAAVCAIGAYFASMALLIQRGRAAFYYIASISAMAFLSVFLFFILKAIQSKKQFLRIAYMALAGMGFALAFLSRINSVLPAVFVIAVFVVICVLNGIKSKKIPSLIGELAALGLPVAAAIAFSLWYNNARFGSPLQFGTDYQLTVADASQYELFSGGFAAAIYHYFLQPFVTGDFFPYIQLNFMRLADYGRSMYIDSSFGLFAVPFMLSLLLSPMLFKSKEISKNGKILLAVSLAALPVTAFADFCLGGVIFRYTTDLTLFAAFVSAVILLEFCSLMRDKYGEGFAHTVMKCITALTAATVIITFLVSVSLNANLVAYDPDIYVAMKEFFVFWS